LDAAPPPATQVRAADPWGRPIVGAKCVSNVQKPIPGYLESEQETYLEDPVYDTANTSGQASRIEGIRKSTAGSWMNAVRSITVREGDHSVNLAAVYGLRSSIEPFVTLTGDYRDVDLVTGWSPANPGTRTWVAFQASYGNGFLDTLEHRQQYKVNGFRVFDIGRHQITLFGIGYYSQSKVPGLVPIDVPNLHDTIDPRQRDQTHTGEVAVNDVWRSARGTTVETGQHPVFARRGGANARSETGDQRLFLRLDIINCDARLSRQRCQLPVPSQPECKSQQKYSENQGVRPNPQHNGQCSSARCEQDQ